MIETGAVQVYLHQPPLGSGNAPLHEVGCAVKAPIVVFVPARVSAEGVMLVTLAPVLFVTVITNVAVSPEKWQVVSATYGPVIAIPTLNGLTLSTFELPVREVAAPPPMRTSVTLYVTVPLLAKTVVQLVYVIVPDAPAARLNGLGLVVGGGAEQFGDAPNPTDVVAVGGLGLATMPFSVATEMFFTVITMRKVAPAAIAEVGTPEVSVV